jgi:hypothetical protein
MSTRSHRGPRATAVAVVVLLLIGGLASCSPLVSSAGCPSWAGYDTPAEAADAADAVVFGVVRKQSGTVPMFGTTANVWTVRVDAWLKGAGPEEISVVSPTAACGPDDSVEFPDPFHEVGEQPVIVFISPSESGWQALSPGQGIVPSSDGRLPEAWPKSP